MDLSQAAEALPRAHPAELLIDGAAAFAGEISAMLEKGLLLSDSRQLQGLQQGTTVNVPIGSKAELAFGDLFDENGEQVVVPVLVTRAQGTDVQLSFRDQSAAATATVQRLLQAEMARTDAFAGHGETLAEFRARAMKQLDRIFQKFLLDGTDKLVNLAAAQGIREKQDAMYESMNLLKNGQDIIEEQFHDTIDKLFDEPRLPEAEEHALAEEAEEELESSKLNLVDLQEYEDELSIERLVQKGRAIYGLQMEALTIRFAELVGMDPMRTRLPIHVGNICKAFRDAIHDQGIAGDAVPELINFFGQEVVKNLENFYNSINVFLRDRGIEPDLDKDLAANGSLFERWKKDEAKQESEKLLEEARQAGLAEGAGAPMDAGVGRFDAPTLYRSVIEALNFRRNSPFARSPASPDAGMGTGEGPRATSNALAKALHMLQLDKIARTEMQETRSVRQYLSDQQENIEHLKGTDGFEPESINQLDLVDNLFTDISDDVDVEPELKPAVTDLQIPLAKLALLEPQFFADVNHPARGVVDKVTQLASSSNYPNRALEAKVSGIIDQIVKNYKADSTVFETALGELAGLTQQQQKALERNVERVVKTQDGQEKLKKAEKAVERVLRNRIRPPRAPKPLVELVDKGWRDLLKLTYVKRGPNSKEWKEYVKTLDLLSLWLMQSSKGGEVDEEVKVQRALEAEPLLDMVSYQISEALPTHVEHEPVLETLREVLAGREELEFSDLEPYEKEEVSKPEEVRKKVEQLPRLRRWLRRVEDLERGTWLTYRDSQGARRRMQLAWVNDDHDRFIFVNERGQKVADVSGVELARKLSRGAKPPTPSEELPLIDQSMYKTLEHVQRSLSFEKNHDSLTRLINRDTFMEQIEQALKHAKTKHSDHALLYIDIDKFGIVNDVYDETIGDQILVEFGTLLAQQHGRKISSARLEGDRFGVLLLDRTMEQAIVHAEGIRSDIEASPVEVNGEKIAFTVSIGIAAVLDHTESTEMAIENAALAARTAKETGGNRVNQYNEDKAKAEAYKAEEAEAIKQIQETLDTKNFVLQAQPIARTNPVDGELVVEHYEILLAIADASGKLNSPVDFIRSAEQFGYMVQVDQWVIRQVFVWLNQMMDEEKEVPNFAINLSGNSVTDDKFMEFLFEAISEYGVGTSKICFEITETGTIDNMVKAIDFVNEFKNIGCKFSIDDFGTGLASHSYLRDLPVDFVKIDGTFIQNIHTNPKDYAMAKSINDLAHFLGQETIAEFAENDEVIEKIREIGVDYIQGWGVGRPAPLSDLANKLSMLEK
jgi:diguanylate cyclase (GGDEF)-like protein